MRRRRAPRVERISCRGWSRCRQTASPARRAPSATRSSDSPPPRSRRDPTADEAAARALDVLETPPDAPQDADASCRPWTGLRHRPRPPPLPDTESPVRESRSDVRGGHAEPRIDRGGPGDSIADSRRENRVPRRTTIGREVERPEAASDGHAGLPQANGCGETRSIPTTGCGRIDKSVHASNRSPRRHARPRRSGATTIRWPRRPAAARCDPVRSKTGHAPSKARSNPSAQLPSRP